MNSRREPADPVRPAPCRGSLRKAGLACLAVAALLVSACASEKSPDPEPTGKTAAPSTPTAIPLSSAMPVAVAGADLTRPMVAVDTNRDRVYVTWTTVPNDTDAISYLAVSTDGGKTFSQPTQLGLEVGGKGEFWTVPRVAANGTLFIAWTHWQLDVLTDPDDPYSNAAWNYVVRSDDGGQTLSKPVLVESERPAEAHYYMSLAVSPDANDVTVSWFDYTAEVPSASDGLGRDATTMWAATSHDGGASFGTATRLSTGTCVCCMPASVYRGGHPGFAFRDWLEGGDEGDIRNPSFVLSSDAGDTWSSPTTIHEDNFRLAECPHVGFGAAVDSKDGVHVTWWTGTPGAEGYYYSKSTDAVSFTKPVLLASQKSIPHETDVALVIDGADTAIAVTANPAEGGDDAVALAANTVLTLWTISGETAPHEIATVNGVYPQLAATADGAILIYWDGQRIMARAVTAD